MNNKMMMHPMRNALNLWAGGLYVLGVVGIVSKTPFTGLMLMAAALAAALTSMWMVDTGVPRNSVDYPVPPAPPPTQKV